ncbi:MAG: GlsB/YeaQ/YmgE family stress response membrane protein [Bacteroidales bacterium]|nr:GlsB/YeaQ/YmgE family stress response membrane protein [Bacteroidales bacterium]
MNIIITLLIGAVAGWLAGFFVVKDKGGLIWNILIGLAGGFVGGWLLGKLGATSPFWAQWYGQIVSAVIGAVILLAIWNIVKKAFK